MGYFIFFLHELAFLPSCNLTYALKEIKCAKNYCSLKEKKLQGDSVKKTLEVKCSGFRCKISRGCEVKLLREVSWIYSTELYIFETSTQYFSDG